MIRKKEKKKTWPVINNSLRELGFDPFTKAEPGLVAETARLVGALPRGGIVEELDSDKREAGREMGGALEGVGVTDKARTRGGWAG